MIAARSHACSSLRASACEANPLKEIRWGFLKIEDKKGLILKEGDKGLGFLKI